MTDGSTTITIKRNQLKSCTSSMSGANNDVLAFNIYLIEQYQPGLAEKLMKFYDAIPLYAREIEAER